MLKANKYLILIFITFSFAVLGVSYLVIHSRLFMKNPEILSFGLTFDMTILFPRQERKIAKSFINSHIHFVPYGCFFDSSPESPSIPGFDKICDFSFRNIYHLFFGF
jgi:hypothetical protein